MIKVGLTGTIGSGKSTVARIFESLGVPVFHADIEAKKILDLPEIQSALIHAFGNLVITHHRVDRKALAKIVFNDTPALEKLNAIIHPRVRQNLIQWFAKQSKQTMAIEEAAILFETGSYQLFDKIINVSCPESLCIQRVMSRDKITREEVLLRMSNQWSLERKEALSDRIILNDEKHLLIPQVLNAWTEIAQGH